MLIKSPPDCRIEYRPPRLDSYKIGDVRTYLAFVDRPRSKVVVAKPAQHMQIWYYLCIFMYRKMPIKSPCSGRIEYRPPRFSSYKIGDACKYLVQIDGVLFGGE